MIVTMNFWIPRASASGPEMSRPTLVQVCESQNVLVQTNRGHEQTVVDQTALLQVEFILNVVVG